MGIMLVYDITNPKSFDNIAKWLRNIDEHANKDVEKMILGNKCDMEDKRVIPKEKGEDVSKPTVHKWKWTHRSFYIMYYNFHCSNFLLILIF